MPMLESIAKGGPRHLVKISAPSTWDGRIAKPNRACNKTDFYPGYYYWRFDEWVWEVESEARRRARAHSNKFYE